MKLELVPEIPAVKLTALLDALEKFYSYSRWLDLVENNEKSDAFSDDYMPKDSEIMWVEALEIGTPNFIKLRGAKTFIVAASLYIATITGGPQAVLELGKTIAEIDYKIALKDKTNVEIDNLKIDGLLKKIDLREQITKLEERGKISSEESKQKKEQMDVVDNKAKDGASIVKEGSIKFL
jgi:hypothetical protein